MKIQSQCVPCLLKRIIYETEINTKDPEIKDKVIKNACKILSKNYSYKFNSAEIATKVHKIAYNTLNNIDPYNMFYHRK